MKKNKLIDLEAKEWSACRHRTDTQQELNQNRLSWFWLGLKKTLMYIIIILIFLHIYWLLILLHIYSPVIYVMETCYTLCDDIHVHQTAHGLGLHKVLIQWTPSLKFPC